MIIRYAYINYVDNGTVATYSSQLAGLPATNVQNQIRAKKWRTYDGFSIGTHNNLMPFIDSGTTVLSATVPSGDYTGSGLASAIEDAMNTVGVYSTHTASYNSTTGKFQIGRTSTASGGVIELAFDNALQIHNTVAVLTGFTHGAAQAGATMYTSTATFGCEHLIEISFSATQSVSVLIIDKHNFAADTVVRFRGATNTSTAFEGGWKPTSTITLSATIPVTSDIIVRFQTGTAFKAMQLYWYNHSQSQSEIGRIWAGTYFEPSYHQTSPITYALKNINEQTKTFVSEAGVTFADRRDPLREYTFPVEPMSVYWNSATLSGYEALVDEVGNHKPFYVTFRAESPVSNTVYGFFVGDFKWDRQSMTPIWNLGPLKLREQK